LKEPLRGEMFGRLRRGETTHNCDTLSNALFYATSPSSFDSHYRLSYLLGIVMFYDGDARQELDHRADGWDMAKECAPDNWLKPKDGGEDKAIVDSPAPKDSWQESQNMGIHSAIRNHPKLGGKQPEPAVVGYEEPKPIDTIEKKHELRIKNLELVNKWQSDEIEFLKGYIDLVIAKVGQMAPQVEMLEKRVQAFNEK